MALLNGDAALIEMYIYSDSANECCANNVLMRYIERAVCLRSILNSDYDMQPS